MSSLIHLWHHCCGCGARPIVGLRLSCQTCPAGPENDLCEECYAALVRTPERLAAPVRATGASRHAGHHFVSHRGYPAAAYERYLTMPLVSTPGPAVPRGAIVRPEFRCGPDSYVGSYGFIVGLEEDGPTFLLTALHVVDEVAKAHRVNLAAAGGSLRLPELIDRVTLYDVMAKRWVFAEIGWCDRMVPLRQSVVHDLEPFSQQDVAVFHVASSGGTRALRLAASPPPGSPIWLSAPDATGSRTRAAVVVESTPELFVFRLEDAPPPRSSGAPLLDRSGAVVGLIAGSGFLDGHYFGHGSRAETIQPILSAAQLRVTGVESI